MLLVEVVISVHDELKLVEVVMSVQEEVVTVGPVDAEPKELVEVGWGNKLVLHPTVDVTVTVVVTPEH